MQYLIVDTETTGLDPFNGDKPFLITHSNGEKHTAVWIGEDDMVPIDLALMSPNFEKIMFNAKFDMAMLNRIGMEVKGNIHDVMIMAHVYNPDEPSKKLKILAKKYLGIDNDDEKKLKEYMRKNKLKSYDQIPRDIIEPYAINDVVITWKLFEFYKEKGILGDPVYKLEMKLLNCMLAMWRRGHLIDVEYCNKMSVTCEERIAEINRIVDERWGEINLMSNKQLGKFLFEDEGLTCAMLSAAGNPVLDDRMLGQYDHEIIPLVKELREMVKLNKTYLVGIADKCDPGNVIHCDYYQVGAKTGRFACHKPNLQNIPREGSVNIRRAFICRPGYVNVYIDYSQIELRVLAHYCKDDKMIDILSDKNGDIHGETATGIFGKDFTKEQRYIAKRINFGIVYGVGPKRFTEILAADCPESDYTYNDAFRFINKYHKTYPRVKPFMWAVQRRVAERSMLQCDRPTGYVADIFGRKYPCPKEMAYKAVNYLIQGCAAGILKKAMIDVHEFLKDKKSNILLTVHDELAIEMHKDELDLVPKIVNIMENKQDFRVPVWVSVEGTSTSWAEKSEEYFQTLSHA